MLARSLGAAYNRRARQQNISIGGWISGIRPWGWMAADIWGGPLMLALTEHADTATALALRAQDPHLSPEEREEVWNKLVPLIREWMENWFGEGSEIYQEGISWIHKRLCEFQGGNFRSWCYVVLYNRKKDLRRPKGLRFCRLLTDGDQELPASSPTPDQVIIDMEEREQKRKQLQQAFQSLREELTRLGACWLQSARSNSVCYFAVLLVHLRLALGRFLREAQADGEIAGNGRLSCFGDLVAWCLPWSAEEEQLCFKAGWPRLGRLWEGLCQVLEKSPGKFTGEDFCAWMTETFQPLRAGLWAQWVKRAKELARQNVAPPVWQALFARLLPDVTRTDDAV
jgi:DNA-directed RNA polymerase specialized sigma24 family protein